MDLKGCTKGVKVMAFVSFFVMGLLYAQTNTPAQNAQNIANQLCSVVALVADIVGVLAILMFVLGGVLYAFAHFLPASGNLKGSMQGWGMGILMGGIIMLVLYLLAPFIVSHIINASQGGIIPGIANVACNAAGQATNVPT